MKKFLQSMVFLAIAPVISGCGGGSTSDTPGSSDPVNQFTLPTALEWSTTYGLYAVKADSFWDTGYGEGQVVAVVDSGVDNPMYSPCPIEFSADDAPFCIGLIGIKDGGDGTVFEDRLLEGYGTEIGDAIFTAGGGSDEDLPTNSVSRSHGTMVASVIAGANISYGFANYEFRGIAPDAQILPIEAYFSSDDPLVDAFVGSGYLGTVVARGIDQVITHNEMVDAFNTANPTAEQMNRVSVINLSLGCPQSLNSNNCTVDSQIEEALLEATGAGIAVVMSAGNDGNEYDVSTPASLAGDPRFGGLLLAVGSIDENFEISDFSNKCNPSDPTFCIVAPGDGPDTCDAVASGGCGIIAATIHGQLATVRGTSFSAPYVSGAIALLLSADPNLSVQDAIEIITLTAYDPNSLYDIDELYGNGILDLDAALSYFGTLSNTMSDEGADVLSAGLSLSQPFGDALQNSSALGTAILYDDYDRTYVLDLTSQVSSQMAEVNFSSFTGDGSASESISNDFGAFETIVGFTVNESSEDGSSEFGGLSFRVEKKLTNNGRWFVGFSEYGGDFSDPLSSDDAVATFGMTETLSSQDILSSAQLSQFGMSRVYGQTKLIGSFSSFEGEEALEFSALAQHHYNSNVYAIGEMRILQESSSFLGAESSDGTVGDYSANSVIGTIGLGMKTGKTHLFANVLYGKSDVAVNGETLFESIDDVAIRAVSASLAQSDLFVDGDRLGLTLGLPSRVVSGSATVQFDSTEGEDISLVPSGWQKNIEIGYRRPWGKSGEMRIGAAMIVDPGHDADAATEYALGLRLVSEF